MAELEEVAPAFIEMAHRIVWCSVATVDHQLRPRTRILHPLWEWDDSTLVGWIATGPTPTKRSHLAHSPYVACSYWTDNHDTCSAECRAEWHYDDETRITIWDRFKTRARAGRLRPRDRSRVDQSDRRHVRRAPTRAVAAPRVPRNRVADRRRSRRRTRLESSGRARRDHAGLVSEHYEQASVGVSPTPLPTPLLLEALRG